MPTGVCVCDVEATSSLLVSQNSRYDLIRFDSDIITDSLLETGSISLCVVLRKNSYFCVISQIKPNHFRLLLSLLEVVMLAKSPKKRYDWCCHLVDLNNSSFFAASLWCWKKTQPVREEHQTGRHFLCPASFRCFHHVSWWRIVTAVIYLSRF